MNLSAAVSISGASILKQKLVTTSAGQART
jgi:hypothetical protein